MPLQASLLPIQQLRARHCRSAVLLDPASSTVRSIGPTSSVYRLQGSARPRCELRDDGKESENAPTPQRITSISYIVQQLVTSGSLGHTALASSAGVRERGTT